MYMDRFTFLLLRLGFGGKLFGPLDAPNRNEGTRLGRNASAVLFARQSPVFEMQDPVAVREHPGIVRHHDHRAAMLVRESL
jgi:hypothetical protein